MKNNQPPQLLETPVQHNGDGREGLVDDVHDDHGDHGDHVDKDLLLKLDGSIGLGGGGEP